MQLTDSCSDCIRIQQGFGFIFLAGKIVGGKTKDLCARTHREGDKPKPTPRVAPRRLVHSSSVNDVTALRKC